MGLYGLTILILAIYGNYEGVYIMSVFFAWMLVIYIAWKTYFMHVLSNVSDDKSRMILSYVSGAWAVLSIIIFGTFQYMDSDHNTGESSKLGKSFYKVGYAHPLVVFGIVVDNWQRYTLILIYQFTRSLIGAVLNNFFWPWITNTIRNIDSNEIKMDSSSASKDLVAMYGFSQFCAQVFFYVSSVTDVFFALSQLDFLIMRWVVDASVSWASTTFFLMRRIEGGNRGGYVTTVSNPMTQMYRGVTKPIEL